MMIACTVAQLKKDGFIVLSKIMEQGLAVNMFTENHFRIENRFDVFPGKRYWWKWHDIRTGERGRAESLKLHKLVPEYLEAHPFQKKKEYPHSYYVPALGTVEGPKPQGTFEEQLKELYTSDAPWEKVWELVSSKIEEASCQKK
jgi:hypothetical protein